MAVPDCQTCGACCTDQIVTIVPGEHGKIPLFMQDGCFMRRVSGRCIALEGRVGIEVRCSIYQARPFVCRVFRPGVPECLAVRAAHGITRVA